MYRGHLITGSKHIFRPHRYMSIHFAIFHNNPKSQICEGWSSLRTRIALVGLAGGDVFVSENGREDPTFIGYYRTSNIVYGCLKVSPYLQISRVYFPLSYLFFFYCSLGYFKNCIIVLIHVNLIVL